jgi:phosphoenolpyruvate-protein phosphotransferase (PTS system enzyme I)
MEHVFTVRIPEGLHARPCVKLVDILKNFAPVQITVNGHTLSDLSILELLLLKITYGSAVTIACTQPLPKTALAALTQLFDNV